MKKWGLILGVSMAVILTTACGSASGKESTDKVNQENAPIQETREQMNARHRQDAHPAVAAQMRLMLEHNPDQMTAPYLKMAKDWAMWLENYHIDLIDGDVLKNDEGDFPNRKASPFKFKEVQQKYAPVLDKTKAALLKAPLTDLSLTIDLGHFSTYGYDIETSTFNTPLARFDHLVRPYESLRQWNGYYNSARSTDIPCTPVNIESFTMEDKHTKAFFQMRDQRLHAKVAFDMTWVENKGPFAQIKNISFHLSDGTTFATYSEF